LLPIVDAINELRLSDSVSARFELRLETALENDIKFKAKDYSQEDRG
jgi:hypothetical protein